MRTSHRHEFVPWLAFLGCLSLLFLPGLMYSQVPAFRDGYHFYYPQAVWLDRCAARGELFPIWNPDEGLGVSVAGQPSAALFYPLRILWWLPLLSLPQRYAMVLVIHAFIAALGMRYAARGLHLSRAAVLLASFSYALSCPVIFQHTNLIYLCSAAWIGFALGALVRLLRTEAPELGRSCLVFAAACSLMLLGGDPHTTANALIVAGLAVLVKTASGLRARPADPVPTARMVGDKLQYLSWLMLGCLLIAGLTAIQWIPAARWSSHSNRLTQPVISTTHTPTLAAILKETPATSHRIYDFSLSPWYLASAVWPTIGGHYLPQNSRLFDAIPSESRMWIPAIYVGLLPCWLLLTSLRMRRLATSPARWLLGLLIFSLLAALGNYSVVWVLRECWRGLGWHGLAGGLPKDHIGSLYWLLAESLPGYSAFRYPAKWTVWFAAASCLLAAQQLNVGSHRLLAERPARRLTQWMLGVSIVGLVASLILWSLAALGETAGLDRWLAEVASDPLLGAPSGRAIGRTCSLAFAIPTILLGLQLRRSLSVTAIAWLTLAEMTFVAMQWVVFAPAPEAPPVPPPGEQRSFLWAKSVAASAADGPPLLGKLGSLADARWLDATQSIEPAALSRLKSWLRARDHLSPAAPQLDAALAELGVTHRLIQSQHDAGGAEFQWLAVDNSKPLCELIFDNPLADSHAPARGAVEWLWRDKTELEIRVDSPERCVLLVRQTNDGGWRVHAVNADSTPTPAESALFIEVDLPAGQSSLVLSRKWLW